MMVCYVNFFFFATVIFLLMRQEIRCERLFLAQISHIFFISQDAADDGIRPQGNTLRPKSFLSQFSGDDMRTLALIRIFVKDRFDNRYFFRIDGKLAISDRKSTRLNSSH